MSIKSFLESFLMLLLFGLHSGESRIDLCEFGPQSVPLLSLSFELLHTTKKRNMALGLFADHFNLSSSLRGSLKIGLSLAAEKLCLLVFGPRSVNRCGDL